MTVPAEIVGRAGLRAGDVLRVELDEHNRVVLTPLDTERARKVRALEELSSLLTGVYEPGYLEKLRGEWRA